MMHDENDPKHRESGESVELVELARLSREVKRLTLEHEILSHVARWYAGTAKASKKRAKS